MDNELKTYPIEYLPMPSSDVHIVSKGSTDKAIIVEAQKRAKTAWDKTLDSFRRELESNLRTYRLDMARQGKGRYSRQVPTRQIRKRIKRRYK